MIVFFAAGFGVGLAMLVYSITLLHASARFPLPRRLRLAPPLPPPMELKAPDPGVHQCPVCGLCDLEERAVGDSVLELTGDQARVVPYGSARAHAECAAVRPYDGPKVDPSPAWDWRCMFCGANGLAESMQEHADWCVGRLYSVPPTGYSVPHSPLVVVDPEAWADKFEHDVADACQKVLRYTQQRVRGER